MSDRSLLVVDDSATFRQLLCMSLTRVEGIKQANITQAENGEDAFNKVREGNFDLVLTDINMPKMNGLEFVHKVRTELKRENLPIIIISTKGAENEIEKGMQMGANGYISKPISTIQLREVLQNYLSK
jgi:two-component system, chemotaxis family, chemotaxis protein CheY